MTRKYDYLLNKIQVDNEYEYLLNEPYHIKRDGSIYFVSIKIDGRWQRLQRIIMGLILKRPLLKHEKIMFNNNDSLDYRTVNLYIHVGKYKHLLTNIDISTEYQYLLDDNTHYIDAFHINTPKPYYYVRVAIDGKNQLLHRIIMAAVLNRVLLEYEFVDHINHNGLDNTIQNLRVCTHVENMRNREKQKGCTSKYKGVAWDKREGKWRADIRNSTNRIFLGYFGVEDAAATAYNRAALEYFGEFAHLNVIGG